MRLVLATALLAGAAPALADTVTLLNEVQIPRDTTFDGTLVGGLSSLDYDPVTSLYWAISDDRGNDREGSGPPRWYGLDIEVGPGGIEGVDVEEVAIFETPEGTPFADGTVDPEGLRRLLSGNFLWSSEGIRQEVDGEDTRRDPFIREATPGGAYVREFAVPGYYSTAPDDAGTRSNFGFESLTLSPDGKTAFTINENALIQDGPGATFGVKGVTRLGVYDVATGAPSAEYVYLADAPRERPDPSDATSFSGVVEMLALDGDSFLMLERQFTIGSPTASTGNHLMRLYLAEIFDDTTDVLGVEALDGAAFVPMRKHLVADLNELVPFLYNVEGLAFAPDDDPGDGLRTLLLNADNNFGADTPQQFIALSVPDDALAPIPLPGSAWLLAAAAAGLLLLRRRG